MQILPSVMYFQNNNINLCYGKISADCTIQTRLTTGYKQVVTAMSFMLTA
jgi:hypothetical protein